MEGYTQVVSSPPTPGSQARERGVPEQGAALRRYDEPLA